MSWLDLILGVATAWCVGSALFASLHALVLHMYDKHSRSEAEEAFLWGVLSFILATLQVTT